MVSVSESGLRGTYEGGDHEIDSAVPAVCGSARDSSGPRWW